MWMAIGIRMDIVNTVNTSNTIIRVCTIFFWFEVETFNFKLKQNKIKIDIKKKVDYDCWIETHSQLAYG